MDTKLLSDFAEFVRWKAEREVAAPHIRQLWEDWRNWAIAGNIPSWENNRRCMERYVFPFWGELQWVQVTQSKWDEYLRWRKARLTQRKRIPAASTTNGELRALKAACAWNVRRGVIPRNPFSGIVEENAPNDRDFYLDDEQFRRLIAHARKVSLKLMLTLYFETGCRRDEIRCLKKAEFNRQLSAIMLPGPRTKTGEPRLVPLSDIALEALDLAIKRTSGADTPYVFPSVRDPQKPMTTSTLWSWLQVALKHSGVKGPQNQHVWVHTMRHSFSSIQSMAGEMPVKSVMDIVGHKKAEVHAKYVHLSPLFHVTARVALNRRRSPEAVRRLLDELSGKYDPT